MGIMTIRTLVCDRCGTCNPIEDADLDEFGIRQEFSDWLSLSNDRFLCPSCAEGYRLLEARHKVELEDYISNIA